MRGFSFLLLICLSLGLFPAQATTDHWQRSLKSPLKPLRIVSLSPATTEMLYAIGASSQVIGVTDDCNFPLMAQKKAHIGRFGHIQLERIVRLKPDLLVATADMGQALQPLRRLPIPLVTLRTPDLKSIGDNILLLGQMTGHMPEAQREKKRLEQALGRFKPLPKRPRVLYLLWHQPLMVATPAGFIGQILHQAGGQNVVPSQSAPFIHYSLEALLKANPDVIIVPQSIVGKLPLQQPAFQRLTALQRGRLLKINDDIISRPGPRITLALQQIHAYLQQLK